MILNVSNLSKSFGDRVLFQGASFSMEKGDIVGLIGANGTGKTTLFNMITGRLEPDDGQVIMSPHTTLGYLEQHVCADSDKTCYEETITIFEPLKEIERELKSIRKELSEHPDEALIRKQEELLQRYQENDGLTYVSLTHSVLSGLGFSEDEQNLPVKSLSGGQKSKIGLAKLLLQKPDLMLLDEPTNHLDIDSVSWLENFIAASRITTLVISHDRYFLDKICSKTAEIYTGKMFVTDGNYSRHMELRAERELSEERHYDNVMAEVHRLEGVIEQQRRWNREKNIKTAESKQKQINRMTAGLERPEREKHDIHFSFNPSSQSGDDVLELRDVKMEFPGKVLYRNVNFEVKRGECIFIIGDNGIGKTTLVKQILRKGKGVKFGVGVTTGYFDQHQLNLNPTATIFNEIHNAYPGMTDTEVRSSLAAFGFYADKVFETISTLSGGERAKVSLCKLMLQQCNLLILDEPTNHLDIFSMAALEDALSEYEGTLLVISHDRYFINRLADKIVLLRPDGTRTFKGNYDDFTETLEREKTSGVSEDGTAEKPAEKTVGKGGQAYLDKKKLRSEQTRAKTALKRKEQEVSTLEARIEELNEELEKDEYASDFEKITELSAELAECNEKLEAAMEEWESLAETVSSFTD